MRLLSLRYLIRFLPHIGTLRCGTLLHVAECCCTLLHVIAVGCCIFDLRCGKLRNVDGGYASTLSLFLEHMVDTLRRDVVAMFIVRVITIEPTLPRCIWVAPVSNGSLGH